MNIIFSIIAIIVVIALALIVARTKEQRLHALEEFLL